MTCKIVNCSAYWDFSKSLLSFDNSVIVLGSLHQRWWYFSVISKIVWYFWGFFHFLGWRSPYIILVSAPPGMSKAFDTVSRSKLMSILESILADCELHMMHILTNDITLNVRLGDKTGRNINTSVGICQGDCLSALLFIIYLASAIKPLPPHF